MLVEDILKGKELEKELDRDVILIRFGPFSGLDEIHQVDMALFEGIPHEIGDHDGHEVAMDGSYGTFFTYGNNAEELFKAMKPILDQYEFLEGAEIYMEFNTEKEEKLKLEFIFERTNKPTTTND